MDQRQSGNGLSVDPGSRDVRQCRGQHQIGVGVLELPAELAHRTGAERGGGGDGHGVSAGAADDLRDRTEIAEYRNAVDGLQRAAVPSRRTLADADTDDLVAGPRGPAQVAEQLGDGVDIADSEHLRHVLTKVAAMVQPCLLYTSDAAD